MAKIGVTGKSALGLAENILALREMNAIGASAAQIRATVAWLRDFRDNFDNAWQVFGLPGQASIKATVHTMEPMPIGTTVIYFGAEEPPGRDPLGPIIIGSDGKCVADQISVDFFMFGEDVPDLTMGPDPCELKDISIKDFFNGAVYIHCGIPVSRFDVIQFAAYELGVLHSHEGRYQRENADKMAALTQLHSHPPIHLRDNVDYLLLSIARDFAKAQDVDRLLAAAVHFRDQDRRKQGG